MRCQEVLVIQELIIRGYDILIHLTHYVLLEPLARLSCLSEALLWL